MTINFSKRAKELKPSPTFGMDFIVKTLQLRGEKIINLSLGEPDFETPEKIKREGIKAIKEGFTHYTPVAGIYELRKKISEKFKKENNIAYLPDEIVIGVGSKQILYNSFLALCDLGDEVIIPTPTWNSYIEQVKLSGATPVLVALDPPFKFEEEKSYNR